MADEPVVEHARSISGKLTPEAREHFLAQLSLTAHVGQSAAAAGVSPQAVYQLRVRDAGFAEEWRAALLAGYDRIEAALIRKALGVRDDPSFGDEGEIDVSAAIMLLDRHRGTVEKAAKQRKEAAYRAPRDGAAATLLAKLSAHARRTDVEASAEQAKADATAASDGSGEA